MSVSKRPELSVYKSFQRFMKSKNWAIDKIGASLFCTGVPDFYAHHPIHGERWIEIKPEGKRLRPTQFAWCVKMSKGGTKIYVLKDHTDYYLLFAAQDNWRHFLP